tara:strand:- start:17 stop:745 length:729 start_codon:yes stop_codon:yes gene_type:complete
VQKNIALIILFILFGCDSNPQHLEVMVNKTVKVFSKEYHQQAENYTFKWKPPIGPNNEKIKFYLKNDMLIFKPEAVGDYEVNLSIEDISDEVVAKEIYYFKVIPETTEVSIVEPQKTPSSTKQSIPKNKHAKKTRSKPSIKQNTTQSTERKKQRRKSPITQNKYAIQISAWPSLEEARQHQLELLDAGFDAYTQRFYFQKKDEVWYRVRIGHFKNKEIALSVMEQIESSTNIKTWLDILSTK